MSPTPAGDDVTTPRPNANSRWRCGLEPLGIACSAGPTDKGLCCQTEARKSCDAAGTETEHDCMQACSGAATCDISKLRPESRRLTNDSLGPCIPTRATWFSREVIALNTAILVGGILLCCMALPQREAIFVPGPLSKKHAQILGNQLVSDRCSQCHPNSHVNLQASSDANGAGEHLKQAVTQDDLCIQCHQVDLKDAVHRSPHDLTKAQLNSLRAELISEAKWVSSRNSHAEHRPTQCATCHNEHQGSAHDLQAITDQRCQACHQTQFASFGNGHPEFENFPLRTERRIAFDHRAHSEKHFAQKSETFDCKRCHLDPSHPGEAGPVSRTVGFDKACAQCHAQPLEAAISDGWALIQIPSIEPQDILRPDLKLEAWPRAAQFGYDGPLTLPMRILLTADAQVAEAFTRVPASGQLADIDPRKPEQVAAAQTIAGGVRRLLAEIAAEGQAAWHRRLTTVAVNHVQRELTRNEQELIQRMTAGLPPDLFRQIEREWFQAPSNLAADGRGLSPPARSVSYQDDLLADDLLVDDVLLAADELLDGGESLDRERATPTLNRANINPQPKSFAKLNGLKHVLQGGWYLDEDLLAVRYRPSGHADPLLAAWTEYTVLLAARRAASSAPHGLTERSSQLIPGDCTGCHLISDAAHMPVSTSSLSSPWNSIQRSSTLRTFTKFDHQPHLTLPLIRECRYCHVLNSSNKALGETASTAEQPLSSSVSQHKNFPLAELPALSLAHHLHLEFKPMEKSQCTACHRPNSAGDGCTQCHNYHVGQAGFEWSRQ